MNVPCVRAAAATLRRPAPPFVPVPVADVPSAAQVDAFADLMRPHARPCDLLVVSTARASGRVWCELRRPTGRACCVSYSLAHVVLLGDAWAADAAITLLSQLQED